MEYNIREAKREDAGKILFFIRELAAYEDMSDRVCATEELLEEWIFDKGGAKVLFIEEEGKEVGFALYFCNFSTFLGRSGIYLEDLFVLKEYRGKGYGKALLRELARIALREGYGRVDWQCLDWNTPSLEFYKSLGACTLDEWKTCRLEGETIETLANNE